MSKVSTLPTFTSAPNSSQMNDAFTKITEAFDNTVSRDGSSPNTMSADLDLNSNDILNVNTLESENVNVNGTLTVNGSPIGASIPVFSSTEDGLVPASGGGIDNFLRADGTWAEPAGGGGGGSSAWGDLTDVPAPVTALSGVNTGDETAAGILAKLVTVDGTGSGLDADLLDGNSAAAFATAAQGTLAASASQPGHTHAAADVAAPGSTTQIVYNNAGALAGASNVEIENNQLRLEAIASPATPASGGVSLFGRADAGRTVPAFLSQDGFLRDLQSGLGRSSPQIWKGVPGGTTGHIIGMVGPTSVGTNTAAVILATNLYTRTPKIEYLVTVAATNAIAGFRSLQQTVTVGGSAGLGGFHFVGRWGPATGLANDAHRAFFGLSNTTSAPTDQEPSVVLNSVAMGWDSADANIHIIHNDGAGVGTKVDLGVNFPVPVVDRAHLYELALYSPKGSTQLVYCQVTDLVSNAVATAVISTKMPSDTTLLTTRGWMSVGGVSNVVGFGLSSLYLDALL